MAISDLFGTKLYYQNNGDGTYSSGEIPGVVSSALGNPITYERNEMPRAPQAPAPIPTVNSDTPYGPTQPPTVGSVMGTSPAASTPAPTTAQALESIRQQALNLQSQLQSGQVTGLTQKFNAPTPETGIPYQNPNLTQQEEERIRRSQMRMFQREIDATNQIYDQMVRQAQVEGQGRLGSTGAMGARAGILGSDFQLAQEAQVQQQNAGIVGGIQAERSAKVAAIMGKGRQAAVDEIAAKNAAKKQGADAYIKYMSERRERKAGNMSKLAAALVNQGIDPSTMSPEELTQLAKSYDTTKEDIISEYTNAKTTADQAAAKDDTFTLSEGQARYDAQGNVIASRSKTYAPQTDKTTKDTDYLTPDNKKTLLGSGWSASDIDALGSDVKEYGLEQVLANAEANGATPSQVSALERVYKVEDDSTEFLNKDFFSKMYGPAILAEEAKKAGYTKTTGGDDWIPFNEEDGVGDVDAYLASLESFVQQYRDIGYTDKQILDILQ